MIPTQAYSEISIAATATLMAAMQQMNTTYKKLLIVLDDSGEFAGLLSIGDIQRFFLKHQHFDAPITEAMRKKIVVATTDDSIAEIRKMMLEYRAEFMPVLDASGRLVNLHTWEALFGGSPHEQTALDLPVVIMAGGKGTRLKPITNVIPKPLIPVGEKTILERIMDRFMEIGCTDFHLSVNYKADLIRSYLSDLQEDQVQLSYYLEDQPLGTAGSLHLMKAAINRTFFVSNCDIIIDQDYHAIYDYHQSHKNELTLVAAVKHLKIPYGTVEVDQAGYLTQITEKPEFTFLTNAGFYVLEPHLLDEIPEGQFFHITELIEKIAQRGGRVGVFPVNESAWMDIGEWPNYQKTLQRFNVNIPLR